MAESDGARGFGRVFDEIVDDYDRHRPQYPNVLVDRACEAAGLDPGARVLEVGCGTGQLTRSLLERRLQVTAIEPGPRLIARARDQLARAGEVEFIGARLEDAALPRAAFRAAFSASAIHWVDPEVGWRRIADALVDGGTIALVSYFGLEDPHTTEDQRALREVLTRTAPSLAAEWPRYRALDSTQRGVRQRRDNISEVWAWLGSYDIARGYVSELFEDVELATVPIAVQHTADELNALLGTMSFWARLTPRQREELTAGNRALHERLGRPIRSRVLACLVTARRRPRT